MFGGVAGFSDGNLGCGCLGRRSLEAGSRAFYPELDHAAFLVRYIFPESKIVTDESLFLKDEDSIFFILPAIIPLMSFSPYGLSISLAVLAAVFLTLYRAKRWGLDPEPVWEVLPWVLVFGVIGARLYHVLNYLPFYIDHLSLVPQVWLGGMGILGGILGGLLGLALFANLKFSVFNLNSNFKLQISNYLDAAAPGVALAQAIGRMGNIFNRELLPYAVWELVANLLIFLFLLFFERQTSKKIFNFQTSIFNLYLLSYSTARFFLEFFRSDSPWVVGPLTMAQWVSGSIVALILSWRLLTKKSF